MTSNVKLLPLPLLEGVIICNGEHTAAYTAEQMEAYTRANVEHHTKALRAEMDRWKSNYNEAIKLKGRAFAESDRIRQALREQLDWTVRQNDGLLNEGREHAARAERMARALRSILHYIEEGGYGFEHTCERVARAALDQEKGIGVNKQ